MSPHWEVKMRLQKGEHLLKIREDSSPIKFVRTEDESDEPFKLAEESECSWLPSDSSFGR